MKSVVILSLAFGLASLLPAAAQSREEAIPAQSRLAQATTSTAPAQPSIDAGTTSPKKSKTATASKPRRHKKVTSHEPAPRSGAAIVKEGGKTCSGLDQYRVCW
jgi:hypothetical protein